MAGRHGPVIERGGWLVSLAPVSLGVVPVEALGQCMAVSLGVRRVLLAERATSSLPYLGARTSGFGDKMIDRS